MSQNRTFEQNRCSLADDIITSDLRDSGFQRTDSREYLGNDRTGRTGHYTHHGFLADGSLCKRTVAYLRYRNHT